MRGHIRKRGNYYCIVVELGRDINGKRKQKWFSGYKTKKDAEKDIARIINEIETGQFIEMKDLKLTEYWEQWLESIKPNLTKMGFLYYKNMLNSTLNNYLGHMKLNKLTPLHIQAFLNSVIKDKNINGSTLKHYYDLLNASLKQAVKWQLIAFNPCEAIETPRPANKKITVLSPDEANLLLDYAEKSKFKVMYLPLVLALTCGMRRGEILGLQWDDIDFKNNVINIRNNLIYTKDNGLELVDPKTHNSKGSVAMLPLTVEVLKNTKKTQKEYKALIQDKYNDNNFVCTWEDGRIIRPDYLTHTFKKILKSCDLPDMRFHDLRHTHATLLLLKEVNPKIVSERLRHSDISITLNTYSHVLPQMQKDAVNKLSQIFKLGYK